MLKKWLLCFVLLILLSAQDALPLYDLPNAFAPVQQSGNMVLTNGGRLVVSYPLANRVSIISPNQGERDAELATGDYPIGVAITPDSQRALSVSYADGTLSVIDLVNNEITAEYSIGDYPYHVVADDELAYVSMFNNAEVRVIDIETGDILTTIATPEHPTAMALWGSFLYVTHYWSGEFSLIYLPAEKVVQTIQPHPQASLSQAIELNPVNGVVYLPQTLVDAERQQLTPVVKIVDLKTFLVSSQFDLSVSDVPVFMPFSAAQPSNRARLYVGNAGSDTVTVLNLDNETIAASIDVGANPRAIRFNRNFARFYTQDAVDGTISFVNTAFFGLDDSYPILSDTASPELEIGAQLFYSATDSRMSDGAGFTCATCHYLGESDGQTWFDAETPRLVNATITAENLNAHIAMMQGGTGLDVGSLDMLALLRYLEIWQE